MKSLTPIILIAVAVGLFFWQINPTYKKVKELRVEAAHYNEALDTAKELEDLRAKLAKTLSDFSKADLAKLETFMPAHFDSVRLVLDINGIAAKYGIAPRDISIAEAGTAKGAAGSTAIKLYNTATLKFMFNSTYANAVKFLKDMESSLRLIDIAAIQIKPSDKGGYDFGMTINTYWISRK